MGDEAGRDAFVDLIALLEDNCHGATVVPTMPVMSSMMSDSVPSGMPESTKSRAFAPRVDGHEHDLHKQQAPEAEHQRKALEPPEVTGAVLAPRSSAPQ